ncbi:hypothetical protein AOLI_G00312730 [Acnodon oligacanthus]
MHSRGGVHKAVCCETAEHCLDSQPPARALEEMACRSDPLAEGLPLLPHRKCREWSLARGRLYNRPGQREAGRSLNPEHRSRLAFSGWMGLSAAAGCLLDECFLFMWQPQACRALKAALVLCALAWVWVSWKARAVTEVGQARATGVNRSRLQSFHGLPWNLENVPPPPPRSPKGRHGGSLFLTMLCLWEIICLQPCCQRIFGAAHFCHRGFD